MKKLRVSVKHGKAEGVLTFPVPESMVEHIETLRNELFEALCNETAPDAEKTFVVKRNTKTMKFAIGLYDFDIEL